MKLFKPEDFTLSQVEIYHSLIADLANLKLNQWLDAAPTVYGKHPFPMNYIANWANKPTEIDTHTAKLVCIEEIKKDCKHEPLEEIKHTVCKHCGVHLDAEWMVK